MNPKEIAVGGLKRAAARFEKDLEALPPEAFDRCFGGKARAVCDIVCEVNMVNDHIRLTLRREPLFDWPDGWPVAPEGQRTKEAVLAAFRASSALCVATAEAMSDDDLAATFTTEHGDTDGYERCRFMSLHMWYHCGQLNFIQTLLGDDVWH
jgi:hypothetical protein